MKGKWCIILAAMFIFSAFGRQETEVSAKITMRIKKLTAWCCSINPFPHLIVIPDSDILRIQTVWRRLWEPGVSR